MYSLLLVRTRTFTRMLLVCTRMLLVCTCMLLVCYSCVVLVTIHFTRPNEIVILKFET